MFRSLVFLVFSSIAGATAPDVVGGRVLRTDISVVSLRSTSESTILLRENGSYSFLKHATGSVLIESGSTFLTNPPPDGTYSYRRTGEFTGAIEFKDTTVSLPNGGATLLVELRFASPTSGLVTAYTGLNLDQAGRFEFTLNEEAAAQRASVSNVSLRGRTAAGQALIAGFVVPGLEPREAMIRIVGPSLSQFGVTGFWADPDFRIYQRGTQVSLRQIVYSDWSVAPAPSSFRSPTLGFRRLFSYAGAFPLLDASKDAAAVVRLPPGAYTVVAAPASDDVGGEILIEVYFLP